MNKILPGFAISQRPRRSGVWKVLPKQPTTDGKFPDKAWPTLRRKSSGRTAIQSPPTGGQQEAVLSYPQSPESSSIFRLLVFLKYGVTFREIIYQVDIEKNAIAQRKLMAVHRDFWRVQSGIRFEDLKLKFGYRHFQGIPAQSGGWLTQRVQVPGSDPERSCRQRQVTKR